MLLGLVEPTGGRATIGGARYADLDRPADVVGVESSRVVYDVVTGSCP